MCSSRRSAGGPAAQLFPHLAATGLPHPLSRKLLGGLSYVRNILLGSVWAVEPDRPRLKLKLATSCVLGWEEPQNSLSLSFHICEMGTMTVFLSLHTCQSLLITPPFPNIHWLKKYVPSISCVPGTKATAMNDTVPNPHPWRADVLARTQPVNEKKK